MSGTAALLADAAAQRAAEQAARASYGRLVALLAYRWRDLAAAEDALGEAFAAALQHWPRSGVPATPEAWLMKAAQRALQMQARHLRVTQDPLLLALFNEDGPAPALPAVPDERLKLLFVCAHPALPEAVRAPLMLQAVLGLDVKSIADAFLVSPGAMAQRLVRAKAKIRDAGLCFEEPELRELPARLGSVLEAIYGAYTIGRHRGSAIAEAGTPLLPAGLRDEAIFLCRLTVALQPGQPEPLGLLALMLYCEARRPAQYGTDRRFVPLALQDPTQWRRDLLTEAEGCLWAASAQRQPGPFQIEAAIQSAHCQRAHTGIVPWPAIAQLYTALLQHADSVGARVGLAVAQAECGDAAAGLAQLAALPDAATRAYQPYWVARAHLLRLDGQSVAARVAAARAIGLTEDPRLRAFLVQAPF